MTSAPRKLKALHPRPLLVNLEIYLPLDDSKRQYTLQLGHWNYFKKQSHRRRQCIDYDGVSQISEPSLYVPSQSSSLERDTRTITYGEGRDEHGGPLSVVSPCFAESTSDILETKYNLSEAHNTTLASPQYLGAGISAMSISDEVNGGFSI
jgi:hypothetical protein